MTLTESLRAAAATPGCPNPLALMEAVAEIERLRECLVGTRVVIDQMKKHSSPGLHKGFDLWLSRIDEALK